mmetsp:Transcript_850/g.2403  ORF Transcript_850/g.2403 Transcript_850/m.2403 type:complete len:171 (-) Transcript_850:175-687(-)
MAFHIILPGKPMFSLDAFTQTDAHRYVLPVEDAQAINEVVAFLSTPLAADLALGVHIAAPPYTLWHFLGCIHNDSPSAIFKPRYVWSDRDAMPTAAQIGLEIGQRAMLEARQPEKASNEVVEVAKLIGGDLVRYVQSFDGPLPADAMSRWLVKFTNRCSREGINWLQRNT